MSENKFMLDRLWNKALEKDNSRPLVPRDYLYASEIGKPYIDRFLSMTAVPKSNPPNERSLRKFKAGNIWEWIVWYTLERAGIVHQYQGERVTYQYPGMVMVSGRLDVIVGGTPNIKAGQKFLSDYGLPDFFDSIGEMMVELGEIRKTIVEVKSCSAIMYDRMENTHKPQKHHIAQTTHYQKALNLPAVLVYICKDDCRIMHFHLEMGDPLAEEYYRSDIERYSSYYYRNEYPPIEAPLIINEDSKKFEKNWRIEYSDYLTLVYGYATPMEFREDWEKKATRWNRIIERYNTPDVKLTSDNREGMKEIEEYIKEYIETKRFFNTVNI